MDSSTSFQQDNYPREILGLSEWYSPIIPGSGLHPRPQPATDLRTYFSEIDDSWASIYYPSRKGEDVKECHDRAGDFLHALVPEIKRKYAGTHDRVLLVSHAATVIALTRELMGDRSLPLRVGCCSLTELRKKDDSHRVLKNYVPEKLADGAHLKEGSTREWGFEDIQIAEGKVNLIVSLNDRTIVLRIFLQVIEDLGVPGTEHEIDHPVGLQTQATEHARM